MDELISRQQAIDALDVLCQEHRYKIPGKRETYSQYNEAWQDALDRAENAIGNLPSAEPKPYGITDGLDVISRQAAIKATWQDTGYTDPFNVMTAIRDRIEQLPSAEPKIIHCEDCKYGMLDHSFSHQWFCKFKGDEWNNSDYFCGHARKREVTT